MQDTLKEDLEEMDVDWSDVRETASDRVRWRQLVTQCSTWNRRNLLVIVCKRRRLQSPPSYLHGCGRCLVRWCIGIIT